MASKTEPASGEERGGIQSSEHAPNEQQKGRTVVRGTKGIKLSHNVYFVYIYVFIHVI